MNANDFFNNREGIQRPIYRYFIGGYSIGGPIYIPGKFNKDKTAAVLLLVPGIHARRPTDRNDSQHAADRWLSAAATFPIR